jgi:hypothetical protein
MAHDSVRPEDQAMAGSDTSLDEIEIAVLVNRLVETAHPLEELTAEKEVGRLSDSVLHEGLVILRPLHVDERPRCVPLRHLESNPSGDEIGPFQRLETTLEPVRLREAICVAKRKYFPTSRGDRAVARRIRVRRGPGNDPQPPIRRRKPLRVVRRAVVPNDELERGPRESLPFKRSEQAS